MVHIGTFRMARLSIHISGLWQMGGHMDPQSENQAQANFEQAQQQLDQGNVLAALACLERGLAIQDNPLWHSALGFCIAKERGLLTRAFELCRSAVEREPKNPVHYLYLGKVLLIAGKQSEALQTIRQGMTLGGSDPEFVRMLDIIGVRRYPVIKALPRKNPLNKYLGIIFDRLGLR